MLAQSVLADQQSTSFSDLLKQLEHRPDLESLEHQMNAYEASYLRLEAASLTARMAPSMIAELAREEGISVDRWRSEAREGVRILASQLDVQNFEVSIDSKELMIGQDDRHFALMTACLTATVGAKLGVLSRYAIVAVFEDKKWFIVPIDQIEHEARAKRLYPVLADLAFTPPTLRTTPVDSSEEFAEKKLCNDPTA